MPAFSTAGSFSKGERTWDAAFLAFFAFFTALRFLTLLYSPLNLSGDESHYWEWSRNPDVAYYSKGPIVAWLIAAAVYFLGVSEFAVRLPAALCFMIFTLCFYLWVRKLYGVRPAFLAAIVVQGTLAFAQTGYLMTTDAPAILAWLIALYAAYQALFEQRQRAWLLFGIAVGLGIWSKYTLIFLPAGVVLFIVLSPSFRSTLREAWFYIGWLSILAFIFPIVIWNAEHDWVNLAHNRGHVLSESKAALRLQYLPELLLGQIALLGPVLAWAMGAVLKQGIKRTPGTNDALRFFTFTALPLLVFVLFVSLTKRIYANWPLPIYIGALLAVCSYLAESEEHLARYRRVIICGIALNVILVFAAHGPLWGLTYGLPGTLLPTKKLVGWEELATAVKGAAKTDGAEEGFILTDRYMTASALSFYLPNRPAAYLANLDDRRMTQYDIWTEEQDWAALKGRDAWVILAKQKNADLLAPHFKTFERAAVSELEIVYGARPIRHFYLYRGISYDGSSTTPPHAR